MFQRVDAEPFTEWWVERYGLPSEIFRGTSCYRSGVSTVWIAAAAARVPPGARVEGVGFPFLRTESEDPRRWKPTGVAVVAFGSDARRRVIDVRDPEIRRFLAGDALDLPGDPRTPDRGGFLVVRHEGVAVGCGLWHARDQRLTSQVPKGRRIPEVRL